jgi:hypothetical protein
MTRRARVASMLERSVLVALLLLVGLFSTREARAEQAVTETERDDAQNVVFAEALGNGLLYSIDYERLLPAWNLGLRGGISYFTWSVSSYGGSGNLSLASFPLVASWYWGSPNHKLQLGLGTTILYLDASTDSEGTSFGGERAGLGVAATGVVGYRYLPRAGGLSFGAGFTPLVRTSSVLAWGGLNVGYAF